MTPCRLCSALPVTVELADPNLVKHPDNGCQCSGFEGTVGQWEEVMKGPRWRASRRTLLHCLALPTLLACTGCQRADEAGNTPQMTTHNRGISVYVDAETGCEYLTVYAAGITPRLRRDGTPDCPASQSQEPSK